MRTLLELELTPFAIRGVSGFSAPEAASEDGSAVPALPPVVGAGLALGIAAVMNPPPDGAGAAPTSGNADGALVPLGELAATAARGVARVGLLAGISLGSGT